MAYKPFPFTEFGGLDFRSAPDETACIDMLNVVVDVEGQVRSRDGFDNLNSADGGSFQDIGIYRTAAGAYQVLVYDASANTFDAYDSAGATITTSAALGNERGADFVRWGDTTNSYTYISRQTNTPVRWDGAAFSSPAGMPNANRLGVSPIDNRLVAADITTEVSKVQFSDAGAPETWGANNYVHLTPGDGERITGLVGFRDFLIAFKQSKFFVFYGTSTDSSGNPVFNYRTINAGVGLSSPHGFCVAPEGVYFAHSSGIYLTTGGPPTLVSAELTPLFRAESVSSFWQGATRIDTASLTTGSDSFCSMAYIKGRLFVSIATGTGGETFRMFVREAGRWFYWDVPAWSLGVLPISGDERLCFVNGTTDGFIYTMSPSFTTDNGTAITSRYRSGFSDMGIHDEKRIAEWDLWGTGTVDFKTSRDFGSLDTATSFALGTSPAISRTTKAKAKDGTLFSWQVGGSGAWSLQRAVARISHPRPATTKTP